MPVQTRQQRYFALALTQISELEGRAEADFPQQVKTAYGGLCHSLPILIRNDGLCQAIAWIEDQASVTPPTPLSRAYIEIRAHIAALLGMQPIGQAGLLARVQNADISTYMRYTRDILDAWIYYKRFAGSILGVDAAESNRNEVTA